MLPLAYDLGSIYAAENLLLFGKYGWNGVYACRGFMKFVFSNNS